MFSPSRRQFLCSTALGAVSWGASRAVQALAVEPERREPPGDVLITIFQRGGADGLNVVVPYGDDAYYRLRPTLAIPRPRDGQAAAATRAVDLDGFVGLNPELRPLHPLFAAGQLACIHGCGSGDQTRSHFEAMATVERGSTQGAGPASGWLGRHLVTAPRAQVTPLRALALGTGLPDALRGSAGAVALNRLDDFRLRTAGAAPSSRLAAALSDLYRNTDDPIGGAGQETLAVLDRLNRLAPGSYRPANGAAYPDSDLGRGLRQVACLIKGGVGLEVACLDSGGWDTHFVQGQLQPGLLRDLGGALAALARDLGPRLERVTVLVLTEFGRRAYENSSFGTDHGRGACWLLLGGGIAGGRVFADWRGLETDRLEPPGDLPVTIDYRDVLAEVIHHRLGNPRVADIFPGHRPAYRGVTRRQ
ncbi:MAG: DUF1501 domain-containing protein [Gemmataceae bacterium]|nr:DUF1501 domain-containing protein [Gemmataceae bacterium]